MKTLSSPNPWPEALTTVSTLPRSLISNTSLGSLTTLFTTFPPLYTNLFNKNEQ